MAMNGKSLIWIITLVIVLLVCYILWNSKKNNDDNDTDSTENNLLDLQSKVGIDIQHIMHYSLIL